MTVMKRGESWCLRRRVPRRFKPAESRHEVWISLRTDSERMARENAPGVWDEQVRAWEARLAGNHPEAERRYAALQEIAASRGLRYMPIEQVAALPLEQLLSRIEAIANRDGRPDPVAAPAVLGTVRKPVITVTQALEAYWTLAKDKTFGKSEDQIRRWQNPRKKAVRLFVDVVSRTQHTIRSW